MNIKDIKLYNFRNYHEQTIEFEPGINLLVGPNGQGKTNVLEGIYYLLAGKSHRIRQEKELIRWNEKNFYLKGSFHAMQRPITLESYYEPSKKVMKINNLACKKLSDYVGTVNAVFFSPDDMDIIKKSPVERRRFLDLLITQVRPTHISLLNSYLKIIKHKNNLLKNEKNLSSLINQLHIWNEQLIDIGSKIIMNRAWVTEKLNTYCQDIFHRIFSKEDYMELHYLALGNKSKDEALLHFPMLLEKKMNQEIERKSVLFGPHRDELLIELNNKAAKLYASQGQQRILVLSLKLAELEIILNEKGDYPILLLDDVLSELDEYRREYLIKTIESRQKQAIITMTEVDQKISGMKTSIYKVREGSIRRAR